MAGDRLFTRIPPDSSGKRIAATPTAVLEFQPNVGGNSIGYTWVIDKFYTITGFGSVHVHDYYDRGDGTGQLYVHYAKQQTVDEAVPAAGSTIVDPDTMNILGEITNAYDVLISDINVKGFTNPSHGLDVDITGSANVRFAEGLPQLDAWGKLRTSGATQLGDYVFGQEPAFTDNFVPVSLAGGYSTYSDTRHTVTVGVDHTVDPANGFASCSSNQYHHYIAGSSHLYAATALLNSPETTGNTRRWGLFDFKNGFFFQLGTGGVNAADDTGFVVVCRSSIPSAPQKDTIIPRSEWNGDKLDGTGDSQVTLDLSKANLFWIDVQWHGAGRTRFGVYIDGQRVVCHEYYQGNNFGEAVSQTTSLPVCYSTASTVSSASNLYIESWSAAVWSESDIDLRAFGQTATYASPHIDITADVGDDWQFLFALSPRELHSNGEVNHTLYLPTSINAFAHNATDALNLGTEFNPGGDAIIDLKMEINSVHDGHVFQPIASTEVEVSTSGADYQAGKIILQDMFKGRYDNILTDTFNNFQYGAVKNFADDGGTVENTIVSISADTPAVITTGERLAARQPNETTFPFNTGGGRYTLSGTSEAAYNGNSYFVRPTGVNTATLYDAYDPVTGVYSSPVGLGAATGGALGGFQGSRVIWSFYAKTRTTYAPNCKLMVIMNWKEVIQ